jgi:hypothetical protein
MIFVEEDSERNFELKKNLRMSPLYLDEKTLTEIIKHLNRGKVDKNEEDWINHLEEDFKTVKEF